MVGSHHQLLAHLRRDHNLPGLCATASLQQCGWCKRASHAWLRTYRSVLHVCGLQRNCDHGLLFAHPVLVSEAHIRLMSTTAHSRSRSRCGVKDQTRRQRKRLVRSWRARQYKAWSHRLRWLQDLSHSAKYCLESGTKLFTSKRLLTGLELKARHWFWWG